VEAQRAHADVAAMRSVGQRRVPLAGPVLTRATEDVVSCKSMLSKPRPFYGWFVVVAAFAVTFVGFGCAYTFSAFIGALQQEFGTSRGSVSLVFSLAGFL
jgi:hypothetical protein